MPASIQIGLFVLGAALLLVAILGQNVKLFGAEVPAPASMLTRIVSAIVGMGFLVASIGFDRIPKQSAGEVKPKNEMHFTKQGARDFQELLWNMESSDGFEVEIIVLVPHPAKASDSDEAKYPLSALQQFVGEKLYKEGVAGDRILMSNIFDQKQLGNKVEVQVTGFKKIQGKKQVANLHTVLRVE